MEIEDDVAQAAQLFKVLGSSARLALLHTLHQAPASVGELAEKTAMTQPLVSQHLRTLFQSGLVTRDRHGKEVIYQIADKHVAHLIEDAIIHVQEDFPTDN